MNKKKKWIPKQSDKYFFCSERRGILWDYFDERDTRSKEKLYVGNCFRTRDEASANYEEVIKKVTDYYLTIRGSEQ